MDNSWIKTTEQKPEIGDHIEYSEDGITLEGTIRYMGNRQCMLVGSAGDYGYFGEGFATDGSTCESGLICDDPKYWRLS